MFASIRTPIRFPFSMLGSPPIFSASPAKIGYFSNPFFATFPLEKPQYGPVAQLGEHYIRIHTDAHPIPLFPTQRPQFPPQISAKLNISKIHFSQLFRLKKSQYGPVAQLGERSVRIHTDTHPTSFFLQIFSATPCRKIEEKGGGNDDDTGWG